MSGLSGIISKHLPCHHAFADDTQLYLSFKPHNSFFSNFVHSNDKNLFSLGNVEVYGRFVLAFCVFGFDFVFRFLCFCFPIENSQCFLITQGVIKNNILSCFNLWD